MRKSKYRPTRRGSVWRGVIVGAVTAGSGLHAAHAFDIGTSVPELKMRWDNTVKYSTAARLRDRSAALLADPNLDDGDRNFGKGLISSRFDLLSEMDVDYRGFGGRLSGAAWYDRAYQRSTDHDSPVTYNPVSRPFPGFPEATRNVHGRKGELLDAFVYGKFDVAEGLSFRVGRHSLLWGESLFFGGNGIGNGMTSVDVIKAVSVPNTQFKELLRPIGQVSGQLQIRTNLAIGAYYQYKFEPNRLPGSGSYFSPADILPTGGESILVPNPGPGPALVPGLLRGADVQARNSGQGGVQLRWRPENLGADLGFYAIRYHDRAPQLFLAPLQREMYFVYPEDINAYGLSATTTVGEYNLAGEVSIRTNAPLVSHPTLTFVTGSTGGYARGTTLHANFNWLATLGRSLIANEATLLGEIAANYTQKVRENPAAIEVNARRAGLATRLVYEPMYRQVVRGLDVGVPVGIGYTPMGKSSAGGVLGPHRGGDMSIGLNGTYLAVWKFSLNYTHFYGGEGPFTLNNNQTFRQTMKDRDFISLSVQTTF